MQEIKGDLFAQTQADAICITTNGYVKRSGAAVMGRGCAKQAVDAWPGIDFSLGYLLGEMGNVPHLLSSDDRGSPVFHRNNDYHVLPYHIVSFPVKPAEGAIGANACNVIERYRWRYQREGAAEEAPGWQLQASLPLIRASAQVVRDLSDIHGWKAVMIPRPGCGNGELDWETQVKPVLEPLLDWRFYVISY